MSRDPVYRTRRPDWSVAPPPYPAERDYGWIGTEEVRGAIPPWRFRHRRTDPACRLHRRPRGRIGRWWFDRNRGRGCHVCVPPLARRP